MTQSKPADIFLIAGGPQSKNNKEILAEGALRVTPDGKITSIGAVPVRFIKKGDDIIENWQEGSS
jgi:hypothetical protein